MGNGHWSTSSVRPRLNYRDYCTVYVDDANERVVDADVHAHTDTNNDSNTASMFADLPPNIYSHGVLHELQSLLSSSATVTDADTDAYQRYIDSVTVRLSQQQHDLVYHHVNHTMMHAIVTDTMLDQCQHSRHRQALNETWAMLAPLTNSQSSLTVGDSDRAEHHRKASELLRTILAKRGKGKVLNMSYLEYVEKNGAIGSLYSVYDDRALNDLIAELHRLSLDSLTRDELTMAVRMLVELSLKTLSNTHMLLTLSMIGNLYRLYGDIRLPLFSTLSKWSHAVLPLTMMWQKGSERNYISILLKNNSNLLSERDRLWKSAMLGKVQEAFALLDINDSSRLRDNDTNRENVALSIVLAFLLTHMSVMSETALHYDLPLHSLTSLTGHCDTKSHYVSFVLPLVLDYKFENLGVMIDTLSLMLPQRGKGDGNKGAKHQRMYEAVRALFPPHQPLPNALQTVRLLLPLLQSLSQSQGQTQYEFVYGSNGPFYECVDQYNERRIILELLGFIIVTKINSDGSETQYWSLTVSSMDRSLLTYTVNQLQRLSVVYYDTNTQPLPQSLIDKTNSDDAVTLSLLSLLSLLRLFVTVTKRNRVNGSLLSRSSVMCGHHTPMMMMLAESLVVLIGKDETDWCDTGDNNTQWLIKTQSAQLLAETFPVLSSTMQVRVMQHSLVSTPLRWSLLAVLMTEPMAFQYGPSQFSQHGANQTVFERVCRGSHRERPTVGLLNDSEVIDWLVHCHQQGQFTLAGQKDDLGRMKRGNVKLLYDWLSKPSSMLDANNGTSTDSGTLGQSSELTRSQSMTLSESPLPPLLNTSPRLASHSYSEEKRDNGALDTSPQYSPLLSSPLPLGHSRSITSFPSVDSVDFNEYQSLFDLFFYHLTSPQSSQSLIGDVMTLMLAMQRSLVVRVLTPFCQYDRTHSPKLLIALASALLHHTQGFLQALQHTHTHASTDNNNASHRHSENDYGQYGHQPMTSLNPSFPPPVNDSVPQSLVQSFHQSAFPVLLSSFLLQFAHCASLPRLPLEFDDALLSSMHSLFSVCGGYAGLEDDRKFQWLIDRQAEYRKARWFQPFTADSHTLAPSDSNNGSPSDFQSQVTAELALLQSSEPVLSYANLDEFLSFSNILIEPFFAPQPANSSLSTIYGKIGEDRSAEPALLTQAVRLKEDRHLHGVSHELLTLVDSFVFGGCDRETREQFPTVATSHGRVSTLTQAHLSLPSLFVCVQCGTVFPTQRELASHGWTDVLLIDNSQPLIRSRALAKKTHSLSQSSVCCQSDEWFQLFRFHLLWALVKVSHHMSAAAPTSNATLTAPLHTKTHTGRGIGNDTGNDRPLTGVEPVAGMPAMPRSINDWLKSDLMKPGLEDSFVAAPSASILPPLAVSAGSSLGTSVIQSKVSSPRPAHGRSMLESGSDADSNTGQVSQSMFPTSATSDSHVSSGELILPAPLSLTLPSESDKQSVSLHLYDKSDSDRISKVMIDDLAQKGAVTLESPRGGTAITMAAISGAHSGAHTGTNKDSHGDSGNWKPTVDFQPFHSDKSDMGVFHGSRQGLSLSSLSEPYEHANFLHDLIYGDNNAGALDTLIMAQPVMRMFVTKRRMVGKRAIEASRAIVAVLLKHLNKIELALDELSLLEEDSSHRVSSSLLKAWKQGSEVLTDFISQHQQGMQYYCPVRGCDSLTEELNDSTSDASRYKCLTSNHCTSDCIERDTQPYDGMAERVIKNCQFLLKLKPSLTSSPALQLARLNSMRVRKILRIRPPVDTALTPEQSPGIVKKSVNKKPSRTQLLAPAPALQWSTTSAAQQSLIEPGAPLSPISAPVEHRKTVRDGSHSHTINDRTPPTLSQQRRGSHGSIPAVLDSLLTRSTSSQTKRDNLRKAVKRELQAQKWRELRDDLLLHRNSFFHGLNQSPPLSQLILTFVKDCTPQTRYLSENIDEAMRESIRRAERRIKGLESLCLLVKLGGFKCKMWALRELQSVIREWNINDRQTDSVKKTDNASGSNGEISSTTRFPSNDQQAPSTPIAPASLLPLAYRRYDNNLSTCGSARLSLVADAFYVLGGVNVSLMRQCINVLLTAAISGQSQSSSLTLSLSPVGESDDKVMQLSGERPSPTLSLSMSPSLPATNTNIGAYPFHSPLTATLTPSSALSLLVSSLNCWQISFHRSDFTFLRNTGLLSVIETLIQAYPSLTLTTPHTNTNSNSDDRGMTSDNWHKALTIGRSSRNIFRLLVLECLTTESVSSKPVTDDGSDHENDRRGSVSFSSSRRGSVFGGSSLSVDSFENSLINAIFGRLESVLSRAQQRLKSSTSATTAHTSVGSRTAPASVRTLKSQSSLFPLSTEIQCHQDESDCADLLSLLILSCSSARIRLSLTHSRGGSDGSAPTSPIHTHTRTGADNAHQLLSPFSSFSLPLSERCLHLLLSLTSRQSLESLSTRCVRRTLRLCQLLLPLLTPEAVDSVYQSITGNVDTTNDSDNDNDGSTHSHYLYHLLTFAGYLASGRHCERQKFISPFAHSQSVYSELTALIRLLSVSSSWTQCVQQSLSQSLTNLHHQQFPVHDTVALNHFYRGYAALAVYGGNSEVLRVGVRASVARVTDRNEKLSREPHFQYDDSASDSHDLSRFATVVRMTGNQPQIVYEDDATFTVQTVSSTQCQPLSTIPCLMPIHSGSYGAANIGAVVKFINHAFCVSTPQSVFALYPPTISDSGSGDAKDQQLNYIHSLCKVLAVKSLHYALSFALTHAHADTGSVSLLIQAIVRDISPLPHPSSTSVNYGEPSKPINTLISNLLSIAQNTIPLTQGIGKLDELERKQGELQSILHSRALVSSVVPLELKHQGIHIDLCHKALALFSPTEITKGVAWLKRKHIEIKLLEDSRKKENERVSDTMRGLQEMGFDLAVCQRALLLCNGDGTQAVNWLMDRGMQVQEELRAGREGDQWGLEGVDFYQEKGHWIPASVTDTPGANNDSDIVLAPTDPYRRLTLSSASKLKHQSELNERVNHERLGLAGLSSVTCSVEDDDLRVGLTLRVNSAWCITKQQQLAKEQRQSQRRSFPTHRWYFLTEDNNWAPLEAKDASKLEETLEAGHSVTWIGIEDKVPSLVRLDKMCMYSEHSGHSRPIKRRPIETVINVRNRRPSQIEAMLREDEPAVPVLLFNTLTPEMQARANELATLGFPLSHCARALIETRGSTEVAANWIINNESLLGAQDKEEEKKKQKRIEWEKKQRETVEKNANNVDSDSETVSGEESILYDRMFSHSGHSGTVERWSQDKQRVLLSFIDAETSLPSLCWCSLDALEWEDSRVVQLVPELNTRKFQGLSGLALDVASSEFIVYARRVVLLLLYLLSSGHGGGKMEIIKNLSCNVFMKICKFTSVEYGSMTLPINIPHWLQSMQAGDSKGMGMIDGEDDESLNLARTLSHNQSQSPANGDSDSGGESVSVDLWRILRIVLRNPWPVFGTSVRDQLLLSLLDDMRLTLALASGQVRDVDTEHPYQSKVEDKQEVRIENASHLLVTFDRRCNLNQSHACLSFYSDEECTTELAVFSGSAEEFSHVVIPDNHFYYHFTSGSARQKPYEFGFRFRVRPLGYYHKDESAVLSGSLGFPVIALLCDSPLLVDTILSFQHNLDYIECMLRYLTVCRSPCKVLVTRCLTALCARIKTPMQSGYFEVLLRVMEQLFDSNSNSGWGSSPFLMSLIDLIRARPTFKLTDSELWSVESIDNRPNNWFFLTVLRAESLSKSLYHGTRLPSIKLIERAYHEMSDTEVLRWCLKQPELCLKLHKQTKGWNSYRKDWMTGINNFSGWSQASEVLIALKQSLLPECYRANAWTTGTAGREWEDKVKRSQSAADIAKYYIELEAALKWGDQYPESERAFGDTWASRRPDWLGAMRGLAAATQVSIASPAECLDYRWTRSMDEQLVLYIDEMANRTARRLMSLTFRDIEPIPRAEFETHTLYHTLRTVPIEHLRGRFAVLKMISTDYMRVLPVVDLSLSAQWSLASLAKQCAKTLIFQQSKMYLWRSMLGRLYSEERPQFVILNRHEAAKQRKDPKSRLHHSLFYQLYSHVGALVDPASLRRRGQAWQVKFVAEGGHDVGGLYNESLVDICQELQSDGSVHSSQLFPLPLFRLCPNGRHGVGENRNKYIPNSNATSPLELAMLEFLGRLMGICCLDNNRALPLDLSSIVWKFIANEPITGNDLKLIDYHAFNTIQILRNPHLHSLTPSTFDYLFPDMYFTAESSCGREVELCSGGRSRAVTYDNRLVFADLFEHYRLTEFDRQLKAIARGLASVVPYDFLSFFTGQQLEVMITGSPEIDVALLKEKTEYRGSLSLRDRHVQHFWEVLEEFSQAERSSFVQFTSGRSRLPQSALGFGKDMFKLHEHSVSQQAQNLANVDQYLPIAHTCFFALELPRYTSKEVMREKLLYAIQNCVSIDGDATAEGRTNLAMTWSDSD